MSAHLPIARLIILLIVICSGAVRAEDSPKPDEAKLRAAITRSLGFLAREGDVWMNEKDCNACHHMPELLWSHREAKRRGFTIDQKKFDEFSEWADARAKKTNAGLEMTAFMKLAMPDKPAPDLTKLIVDGQQADGSWKPASQFGMQRREAHEATANSARIFLLALASDGADQKTADDARAKAAALVEKSDSPQSVETLVFRTLYARRFGRPQDVDALRTEILKLQHSDGGWAWTIGEAQSDSLATGEALYVLQRSPAVSSADAIPRAQGWLFSRQRKDGGWSIDTTRISKIDRSAPEKSKSLKAVTDIYTYWGTAWATIGLLEGLPVPES